MINQGNYLLQTNLVRTLRSNRLVKYGSDGDKPKLDALKNDVIEEVSEFFFCR